MADFANIDQQPGGLKLHQVELDLYQSHLGEGDQKLESPYQILAYLNDKLGYKRIQSETSVLVKYRPYKSDLLVRYFDGIRGQVVGVDEYGRPWVQFDPKVWVRAVSASKVVSTGQSPFESGEPENIQPRMKSIRLDPLDVYSYRNQVAQLGWSSVKSAVVSTKSWEHLLPSAGKPEEEEEDDFLYLNDDYEREAYFYDPLVTDLVQMSNEQIRYILDNANDFLLDIDEEDNHIPEKDKPNFEDWNPPEGGTFGEALTELDKLIESASSQQNFPSESNPPKNISPDAIKIWNHLMSAPSFVAVLKEYPRRRQWALARYFLVTHAMAAEVLPFVGWAPTVPQVKNHQ